MALTIKSPSNFVVDVTELSTYREYLVKEKYSILRGDSTIYNGSSKIEYILAGNKLVKEVYLVDNNLDLWWLYGTEYRDAYTEGSKYEHLYIGLKSDNTVFTSKDSVGTSSIIKAMGFRFTPVYLYKINTTTHTISLGYYSDFGIDLYHDGTKLYRAYTTLTGNLCYAYYLNDYLVAVYNHSNSSSVQLSKFGGEIPSSIRSLYLPKNSLLFVNDIKIEDMVELSTPSSSSPSGPTVIVSNSIKVSISSSLDSVVFEDSFAGPHVSV